METKSNHQAGLRVETMRYRMPRYTRSGLQALVSFGGFFATCGAIYALAGWSYWVAILLAPLAAGFLVRIFIIQHDCGHQSFFRSRVANDCLGYLCSLLTLTPYELWKRQHAGHHGTWNDLERRQTGVDIYSTCLTVAEYHGLSRRQRVLFAITRHPLVANVLLPPLIFLGLYRIPFDAPAAWRRERLAVYLTDVMLVAVYGGLVVLLGAGTVAAVQLPIMVLAAIVGVWLFSVQHRGENARWEHHKDWDAVSASLDSTNFLCLPGVLNWFTGNIGYHHVHHLNPRIPNYRLRECHAAIPALRNVPTLSLGDGLRAVRYVLWDERQNRMTTLGQSRPAVEIS